MRKTAWLLALLLLLTALLPAKVLAEGDIAAAFKISVDPTAHIDYELGYPATYKFNIPEGSTNLTAWQKKTIGSSWVQLPTKTSEDFFNGIDAVRFDYTDNVTYVSVAFGSTSDDIFILFKDAGDNPVTGISFVETSEYYDNRKAAVTITFDDWQGSPAAAETWTTATNATRSRGLWVTGGITTDQASEWWENIQTILDSGYVEAGSHSRTHPDPPGTPYDTYDT